MRRQPTLNQPDPEHAALFADESFADEATADEAIAAENAIAADEAWAGFAQLLDAAQGDFDAALRDRPELIEAVLSRVVRRRTFGRRRALATAAAVLLCGGAAWFAAGRTAGEADRPPGEVLLATAPDWDDHRLDLELDWMHSQASAIESQWRQTADKAAFVQLQMDALEAEFAGDAL